MRVKLGTVFAAAASLSLAAPAAATITIGSITPGSSSYSGPPPTYNFDTTTPPISGGGIVTGTTTATYAQPLGSTGNYYAVGPSTSSPGTIDLSSFGNITSLSFIWGSVDSYNTLKFLDASNNVLATFTGNDIFNPANGNETSPNTNPIVTFLLTDGSATSFAKLQLSSTVNAFEIDNLAINPVPEPATWAMMLLGFGGIGLAMRRRRKPALTQIA